MPKPDATVFGGTFTLKNGQTLASKQGFTFTIGKGKLFYFQPGHEDQAIFMVPMVRKIMANAVKWAGPAK
jgi:trehalose utilization protein